MNSSFFIVVDRGNVRAYRAEKAQSGQPRPPRLQLVQAFTLTDAHLRTTEKLTDNAGAFPSGTGGFQTSHAERGHLDIEENRRTVKLIAEHIHSVLKSEQPAAWSFAAPSEINNAVLEQLDRGVREKLAENVTADLVNTPQAALLGHFEKVGAGM